MNIPLQVAYTMQNVGVDLTAEVGQMILIRNTVAGLKAAGHRVDLWQLTGRDIFIYPDLLQLADRRTADQGLAGTRLFRFLESGLRRLHRLLRLPYFALFDAYRFFAACRRAAANYDLMHEYAGMFSVGTALACRMAGVPYIMTVDADLILEAEVMGAPLHGLQKKAAHWTAALCYKWADRLIVVSNSTKTHLVAQWQVPADKITVIPNGVDIDKFMTPMDLHNTRTRWGVAAEPVVMFVGGFQMWHGLDKLLVAMAQVRHHFPAARLFLVGDGPARLFVEEKIAELGMQAAVTITGFLPHVAIPELLHIADVVTLPYPQLPAEMWFSPLKLYEYMAAGKAIVASRAGQIEEVLVHQQSGLLVPPGDEAALAAAIIRLLERPQERIELGENAYAEAVGNHSWRRQTERLLAVYQDVLDLKQKGGS